MCYRFLLILPELMTIEYAMIERFFYMQSILLDSNNCKYCLIRRKSESRMDTSASVRLFASLWG